MMNNEDATNMEGNLYSMVSNSDKRASRASKAKDKSEEADMHGN